MKRISNQPQMESQKFLNFVILVGQTEKRRSTTLVSNKPKTGVVRRCLRILRQTFGRKRQAPQGLNLPFPQNLSDLRTRTETCGRWNRRTKVTSGEVEKVVNTNPRDVGLKEIKVPGLDRCLLLVDPFNTLTTVGRCGVWLVWSLVFETTLRTHKISRGPLRSHVDSSP